MGRQPPPGDLPDPGIEPGSPALQAVSLGTLSTSESDLIRKQSVQMNSIKIGSYWRRLDP